jgi:DNA-binding NarL/FixJ family response regulator
VAPSPTAIPWRSLRADALDRLGRTDEAVQDARDEVELARKVGAPGALGRSLRVLGAVLRQDGLEHLEEAIAVLEDSTAKLELGKALAAHGVALRHARRPADAREPLRRALELASVLGADPLAEHARVELHATGARPRADVTSGVGALTASERRVVDLAIEGGSNRDIAQTLYVTPKTVEVHLSNAYRKLGIRSRRELAGVLQAA